MNKKNKRIIPRSKERVLVAPLDWGLGHATRCIPIIKELVSQNCEVYIAADNLTFSLLKKEFPSAVFLRLKGYKINYSREKKWLILKLLLQIPKIVSIIWLEKRWLNKAIKKYGLNAIISDNRLGMHSKKIPSIYITHQLFIKTGNPFTEKMLQAIHYYFIQKYKQCWVPDFKENGLAGNLSHPKKIASNVKYIGAVSRFRKLGGIEKLYDLLICISGPEPQRTILENIMLSQLVNYHGKALLIRGLPSKPSDIFSENKSVKIINHLAAADLNKAFLQSEMIISRSGYTTVMDLINLNKRAILIATPGQTEQEYLAHYLSQKKYFYSALQQKFSLSETLEKVKSFPFAQSLISSEEYKKVIHEFVLSLKTGNFAPQ